MEFELIWFNLECLALDKSFVGFRNLDVGENKIVWFLLIGWFG